MKHLYIRSIFDRAEQNQFYSALFDGIGGTLYTRLTGVWNPFTIRPTLKAFFNFEENNSSFIPRLPMR